MNRDDVIRMAREAGFGPITASTWDVFLENFAALVAAAEREACAAECDKIEKRKWETVINGGLMQGIGARDCAAAIRARGEK